MLVPSLLARRAGSAVATTLRTSRPASFCAVGTNGHIAVPRSGRSGDLPQFLPSSLASFLSPSLSLALPPPPRHRHQHLQVRTVTKKRVHRQEKRRHREDLASRGVVVRPPPHFLPRDAPVRNALSKEERDADSRRQDEAAAAAIQARVRAQNDLPAPMRHGLTADLPMSDRVRRLFDLHVGSQREVVTAQKRQAMDVFKRREGDTGSSAVQVVALTTRIQQIQTHLRAHKKDRHGKRGLDALFVRRRKLLDYMERKDFASYRTVVKTLGLIH